jgi:hypothetical protein
VDTSFVNQALLLGSVDDTVLTMLALDLSMHFEKVLVVE